MQRIALSILCTTWLNTAVAQIIPFDSTRWDIHAKDSQVEEYLGQTALRLSNGKALLKNTTATDGVMEFDVAFKAERGFIGAMWRMQDTENHEEFYLRAHQSGNPDATQYTPVFNGSSAWQLYHGPDYGAPLQHRFEQWQHVKIVFSGQNAAFYLQDMEKPAFTSVMKRGISAGGLGIKANFTTAYFANFSFTAGEQPIAAKPSVTAPAEGTITAWQVSQTFDEQTLAGKTRLTAADKQNLTWTPLSTEASGLANLARVQGTTKQLNTAFARVTIPADSDQIKALQFGFSDRVRIYCNDTLIYSGDNTYRTRDYRFLGSIGLFDTVYLPLRKGDNDLWIAVAETFGGWGLLARLTEAGK